MSRCSSRFNKLGSAVVLLLVAGCGPTQFGPRVGYLADQHHVRDASARRSAKCWYLRFDELAISDLDEAIRAGRSDQGDLMRDKALLAVQEASALALRSISGELDRLPSPARLELSRRAEVRTEPSDLQDVLRERARAETEALLDSIRVQPPRKVVAHLEAIRASIEPAEDDKGRIVRQASLAWAALPAWMGVDSINQKLEAQRQSPPAATLAHPLVWIPPVAGRQDALAVFAPILAMDDPENRTYPVDYDRIGEVFLAGRADDVDVQVRTDRPVVYVYTSEAKIHERRYAQLVYSWWFPHRPAMSPGDPAAGHIDGDTLRVTLGSDNLPAIFEIMQSCGCGHLVYVSDRVEQAARKEFGEPQEPDGLAVRRDTGGANDLVVMGTIPVPAQEPRPLVVIIPGYHNVMAVACEQGPRLRNAHIRQESTYSLVDYDQLERLPLGDGYASMFGPDGLVHKAGRDEGWLLAPTGILSAGQPRARGTQRIHWDEYKFDDPHLLENMLRLPKAL